MFGSEPNPDTLGILHSVNCHTEGFGRPQLHNPHPPRPTPVPPQTWRAFTTDDPSSPVLPPWHTPPVACARYPRVHCPNLSRTRLGRAPVRPSVRRMCEYQADRPQRLSGPARVGTARAGCRPGRSRARAQTNRRCLAANGITAGRHASGQPRTATSRPSPARSRGPKRHRRCAPNSRSRAPHGNPAQSPRRRSAAPLHRR